MKTFLLLLVAAVAFQANADVLMYKHRISTTASGAGVVARYSYTGYTIFDPEEPAWITQVVVNARTKQFWLNEPQGFTIEQVESPKLRTSTVLIQADSWMDIEGYFHTDTGTAKGLNSTNNVGGATLYYVPKSLSWRGSSTYPSLSGKTILEEATGTFSLDTKLSTTANTAGDDVDAAVDRVRQSLLSLGYTEQ